MPGRCETPTTITWVAETPTIATIDQDGVIRRTVPVTQPAQVPFSPGAPPGLVSENGEAAYSVVTVPLDFDKVADVMAEARERISVVNADLHECRDQLPPELFPVDLAWVEGEVLPDAQSIVEAGLGGLPQDLPEEEE